MKRVRLISIAFLTALFLLAPCIADAGGKRLTATADQLRALFVQRLDLGHSSWLRPRFSFRVLPCI